eukprot:SAG31_NODE_824_length_11760_cov_17.390790_7_plen_281_part_00
MRHHLQLHCAGTVHPSNLSDGLLPNRTWILVAGGASVVFLLILVVVSCIYRPSCCRCCEVRCHGYCRANSSAAGNIDRKTVPSRLVAMGTSSAHMGVTQKTGWLTRRGVRGNTWERRFFVLDAEKLRYFQSPSDDEPDGTILLDGTTLALASENVGKSNCFGIYHPIRNTHFMQAGSELEMMQWVRATRREPTVALVDFEMLSKLGESKLGKLVLVKQKPKGRLFAMKILNKSAILGPMETAAQHMQVVSVYFTIASLATAANARAWCSLVTHPCRTNTG